MRWRNRHNFAGLRCWVSAGALLGGYRSSYGVNTGVQLNRKLPSGSVSTAGASYAHSVLSGGTIPDQTQDSVFLNAGIGYQLMDNVNLNANYSFSTQLSNNALVEFNRNRVSVRHGHLLMPTAKTAIRPAGRFGHHESPAGGISRPFS